MLKLTVLLLALLTASNVPASTLQPDFYLQGDGHACSGTLHARNGKLRWESSFSTCDASYRATEDGVGTWTLQLKPLHSTSSKSCSFAFVTIHSTNSEVDYPLWEVKGFRSPNDLNSTPPRPLLDCNMQSVSRKR
jgi:hypothetical protein